MNKCMTKSKEMLLRQALWELILVYDVSSDRQVGRLIKEIEECLKEDDVQGIPV